MKKITPPRESTNMTDFYSLDNCECSCHFREDCKINEQNKLMYNKFHTIHSISPYHAHLASADCLNANEKQNKKMEVLQPSISSGYLCECENICNCPCHCTSCVCCPCVKERSQTSEIENTENYYKKLYIQIKSELEIEKKEIK